MAQGDSGSELHRDGEEGGRWSISERSNESKKELLIKTADEALEVFDNLDQSKTGQ